jgi:hypothetical protein
MSVAPWAIREVGAAQLGDPRRTRRLARLVSDLAAHPEGSLPAACATPAATKAAYRFFDDAAVTPAAILASHVAATVERLRGEATILALQDTTTLDFTHHPAVVGTGPLAHPAQRGLLVHSVLATTPTGAPLGLLHQQTWARDPAAVGQRHTRRQRPTAEKESQRWLDAQAATDAVVPVGTQVITVADREADIYDLFAQSRPPHHELLIRATHNRCIVQEAHYLWAAVRAAPVGDVIPVAVGRRADREPREAWLTLRWVAVTLRPPCNRPRREGLVPIPLVAILAEEPVPPVGEKPIRWLLLTSLPVATGEAALQAVRWYALRWRVERFHYVLKAGCKIEDRQLRTAERLERALAVSTIVAWRLLWLTYLARTTPAAPCTVALTDAEWPVLYVAIHQTPVLPTHPPPLGQAVRWIAQLGGFLGRRGDGDPGPTVLWRGLRRLEDLTLGWQLASAPPPAALTTRLVGNA